MGYPPLALDHEIAIHFAVVARDGDVYHGHRVVQADTIVVVDRNLQLRRVCDRAVPADDEVLVPVWLEGVLLDARAHLLAQHLLGGRCPIVYTHTHTHTHTHPPTHRL